MALAHRIKKREEALIPERQIFVVATFELCGHVDEAAWAQAEAESRAGDMYIMPRMWVLCPRCEPKARPASMMRRGFPPHDASPSERCPHR
jgi:hypothetical protein